jgi:peroxiredoxin
VGSKNGKEIKMKKVVVTALIVSFLFVFVAADQEETVQKIYQLYGQKKYDEALKMAEKAMKEFGTSEKLQQIKYNILVKQKKHGEALAFIDEEIKKSGETEELISAKFKVLYRQGKLHEALKAALKKDKIAKSRSPWDCISIMHVHLRLGNKQDALDWLQEAVSRGFISYRVLAGKMYAPLSQEKRFYDIIETIKVAIGLGNPARNFTVPLLSGEAFDLSKQRGKVVLVDFWATWCDSCREEMPQLKDYYNEFKEKGFEIIGISLDSSEKKLKEYIRENNLAWKFSFSGNVWKDKTVLQYGVNSIPSYWLIDKNGILRSFGLKGEKLHRAIVLLLAE